MITSDQRPTPGPRCAHDIELDGRIDFEPDGGIGRHICRRYDLFNPVLGPEQQPANLTMRLSSGERNDPFDQPA